MSNFSHYQDHTGSNPEKFFKTTIQQSANLLLGINCLDPGQVQKVHTHENQDKFYFVIEGQGEFTVGEEIQTVSSGSVIWAAAGEDHGVTNSSDETLVLLVGIAPAPHPK